MSDDLLRRRLIDRVLGPPNAERDRELDEALLEHPALREEFRRLQEAWDALDELSPHDPPPDARRRALEALLDALEARTALHRWLIWPLRVAAGVAIFLVGAASGVWISTDDLALPTADTPALIEGDERPRYALLIRGFEASGDEAGSIEEMTGWARELWSEDRLVWAERLFPEAVARLGTGSEVEETEPIGLLFMIRAEDREAAIRLARQAPHLAWGGSVEVLPTSEAGR